MKVTCDYCGSMFEDAEQVCPNCGAVNNHNSRLTDGIPKTIEELKAFCAAKKLPLNQMRFYIGEDFKEPKAFGVFKDTDGNFVVYKNKADGSRAIRYRGPDETHAVNEIYQKMRSEVELRQNLNGNSHGSKKKKSLAQRIAYPAVLTAVVGGILGISLFATLNTPTRGYYKYNDHYYYCQGSSDWYYFDPISAIWIFADDIDSELYDNYRDYYEDSSYSSGYGVTDFEDTDYYQESSSNSGWDDGNDWDYGGNWDAGDTDWDTDW